MRTNTCGELTKEDVGQEVVLCGWVQSRRDHGGVIFIDLRDRYGMTQVVFDPSEFPEPHKTAEHLGREWVLQVKGKVRPRPEGMTNTKLVTGEIEVITSKLEILNKSEVPPFEIEDYLDVSEELRLKYRYLDLRRQEMQKHIRLRHEAGQAAREYLTSKSFLEIETPLLVKTTPGGARVFKVPSRVHPGKLFALPESPQIYKQLLMVAGYDRYFQLAKCLRDEDLRADRQPEFTQIDLEMSFVDENDVIKTVEGMLKHIFKTTLDVDIETPFPRLSYHEAMSKYGSDKPDLRYGLQFVDVSEEAAKTEFKVFTQAAEKGKVLCLPVPEASKLTRKDIDQLIEVAKTYRLPGLAWARVQEGKMESSIAKFIPAEAQQALIAKTHAKDGSLLLFAADAFEKAATALGQVRLEVAKKLELTPKQKYALCWVVDFPLYEYDEDAGKWAAKHHIFSMPKEEDMELLEKDPAKVRGKLYDVVLNGVELGGGSIRIHRKDIQAEVLKVIGLSYEEAEKTFDFLLEAFKYGAPPHGGIAVGFDRLIALMLGINDIREVIPFPRTKNTENLMDGSPQPWEKEWLRELHLKLDIAK